jgi:hypothetical protein
MARIVMEQSFEQPMSDQALTDFAKRLDPCLEIRDGTWARSYVSNDRRRMFCEFEAPDAESVREALRSAGIAFDRVWSAQVFDASDYADLGEKLRQVREKLAQRSGKGES